MTHAISTATTNCSIRSAFQYCTSSLRNLVQKVKDAIVTVFQCFFPCIFGKTQPAQITASVTRSLPPSPTAPPAPKAATTEELKGGMAPPPRSLSSVLEDGDSGQAEDAGNDGDNDSDGSEVPSLHNRTLSSTGTAVPDLVFEEEVPLPNGLSQKDSKVAMMVVLDANILETPLEKIDPSVLTQAMKDGLEGFEENRELISEMNSEGFFEMATGEQDPIRLHRVSKKYQKDDGSYLSDETHGFYPLAHALQRTVRAEKKQILAAVVLSLKGQDLVQRIYEVFVSFNHERNECDFYLFNPNAEENHPKATWQKFDQVDQLIGQFPKMRYAMLAFNKPTKSVADDEHKEEV